MDANQILSNNMKAIDNKITMLNNNCYAWRKYNNFLMIEICIFLLHVHCYEFFISVNKEIQK